MFKICLIAGLCLCAVVIECIPLCNSNNGDGMIPDPDDCSSFYWCFGNQPVRYTCQLEEVWNNEKKVCVPKGSDDDTCTKKVKTGGVCGSDHPTNTSYPEKCSKYHECPTGVVRECPYPKLFDEVSKKCDYPERVHCGNRHEPVDPCEYDIHTCRSAMCEPCSDRFPSCKGKPDGLAAWDGREWTPVYTVCKNERVLYTKECFQIRDQAPKFVFDPKNLKCVEQIMITFAPI